MKLITIKIFENAIEAHILKTKLESEGIPAIVVDENVMTLNPFYNIAVGGVKLQIRDEDFEKANAILTEIKQTPITDDNGRTLNCPKCGSANLYTGFKTASNAKGFWAFILSFLYLVFPIHYKSVYRCKDCGNEFTKES
ncbi:hypothetical protein D3C80_1071640 [compost metagenome]